MLHIIKFPPIAAAESNSGVIFQNDDEVAVRPGLEFPDAVDVDDCGPVYARKLAGVQPGFQALKRFPEHVGILARVQFHIVRGRFDPIHIFNLHE